MQMDHKLLLWCTIEALNSTIVIPYTPYAICHNWVSTTRTPRNKAEQSGLEHSRTAARDARARVDNIVLVPLIAMQFAWFAGCVSNRVLPP